MSGTYRALGGESWSDVARSTTGDDLDAAQIQAANPGVLAPLTAGAVIQLPVSAPEVRADSADELEVSVDGIKVAILDDFVLATSIDAISKCQFTVPNEPATRALFRPLTNPSVAVDIEGARVFTGRAASPAAQNEPNRRSLVISCFSTPGILEQVPPPLSAFPLEFVNANLEAIAGELCNFHGVPVNFQSPSGARFSRVDIRPNQVIFSLLSGLAAQRGPVFTSSVAGELVFWGEVASGNPVSRIDESVDTTASLSVNIDEGQYFSKVTGFIPAKTKSRKPGVSFSVTNPHASDLVRPYTFEAQDVDEGELETAVRTAAGRMFAGVFTASLGLPTWRSGSGELYQVNTTVELKSPNNYINDFYEFLVVGVAYTKTSAEKTVALTLALPGVFSGEIPETLPWL